MKFRNQGTQERKIILQPIRETTSDYDAFEKEIMRLFREEIYLPLMQELYFDFKVSNSLQDIHDALQSGKISFDRGRFTGQFDTAVIRELKRLGAKWDRKQGSFAIPLKDLPPALRGSVAAGDRAAQKIFERIDAKLAKLLPEEIAGKIKIQNLFKRSIWKTEADFKKTTKAITVKYQMTEDQVDRMAREWTNNAELYIQKFTKKETVELRNRIKLRVLAGERSAGIAKEIQASYGVSQNKAKFLARQEVALMQAQYKQMRYEEIGITEYIWTCLKSPKDKTPDQHTPGNVRYYHGLLDGKTCSWGSPPVVDEKGNRKHPGQDYNCRCYPKPVVRVASVKEDRKREGTS